MREVVQLIPRSLFLKSLYGFKFRQITTYRNKKEMVTKLVFECSLCLLDIEINEVIPVTIFTTINIIKGSEHQKIFYIGN